MQETKVPERQFSGWSPVYLGVGSILCFLGVDDVHNKEPKGKCGPRRQKLPTLIHQEVLTCGQGTAAPMREG